MKRLTVVTFLFFSFLSFGQTIKGKVTDAVEDIGFADIVIRDNSNTIITGTSSDDNGNFEIKVAKGTYKIVVSFLGYTDWEKQIKVDKNLDLGIIKLEEDSQSLEEVVVQSKRRVIQQKVDRLVFDVEKSVVSEVGNGADILKLAPRVQVQNGAIEILGKGASRVLINGRLSPMEGEELVSFLESLNGNDIKSIEVITNPPAKYEAAGGGLINIILKKAKLNSWHNTSSLVYNQNKFNFATLRNNFSYNKNKFSLVSSLSATKGNLNNIEDLKINYPNSFWDIDIEYKDRRDSYSGRLQMDYKISDNVNIGAQYLGNLNQPGGISSVVSNVFDLSGNLDRVIKNTGENTVNTRNHNVNFYAETKLDTLGRSISFNADYFTYKSDNDRDFITEAFDNSGNSMGITSGGLNMTDQKIENFSSKIDVNYPIDKVQLSFGAKTSNTKINSGVQFFNTLSGSPVLDITNSNDFMYEENNIAGYVSSNFNISEKTKVQLGVRVENTNTLGVSVQTNESNRNNFTQVFPTAYISYKKNDNNTFNFSYGRRIERPRFSDLNPFKIFINDNSFSEGNPFLNPSFMDGFEFTHSYKRKLNSSVFLNVTTNGFGVIFTSDPVEETQIVTRDNYITQYNYGISENYSSSPFSWWESQNSFNVIGYYSKFEKNIGAAPRNGLQLRVATNNTFSVGEKSKLIVNSWYSSPFNGGLYRLGGMYNLSIGYQQSFKNNFKLSVFANDVFNTSAVNNLESVVDGVRQVYGQNYSTRNLVLSLSYSFGNNKIKVNKRNFGNDEEQGRSN
ncbi:TonB-dependent receptor domain-containing protein [Tenacibaculum sp. 190524A05c]|uniref:OMP_b-brl_3 domain-containing protein n=1 Tax=Tenacibaculum platacis TaxID=3137852 RepID=A0ABM9NUL3_9FLAO